MLISIAILAFALSLDALGVGVVYGMRKIRIPFFSKLIICFFSIVYSGAALLAGSLVSDHLPVWVSKLAGVSILSIMGFWIIIQAFTRKETGIKKSAPAHGSTLFKLAIKSLGITIQVIRNPAEVDMDGSGIIDSRESILLGLALSVDAIGVSLGFALAGLDSVIIPFAVGSFQMLMLYLGTYMGIRFVSCSKLNKRLVSLLPGILLIILAFARI